MEQVVLPVRVESLEEGGYLAVCDVIQGCHAEGDTVGEALEELQEVAKTMLEVFKEDGVPLPAELVQFRPGTVIKAELVVPVPE
ncbi:MAG: type II toxin-antitoxin system HicB family antitoxin [Dehalococcoidia bacterium]